MRFIIFYFILFSSLQAQVLDDLKIENKLPLNSLETKEATNPQRIVIGQTYTYYLNSVVVKKNDLNRDLDVEMLGDYLFEYKADKLNGIASQLSEQERYIIVKGIDQRIKFFNGSIMIKFNEPPDFENFALENDLVFVSSLADIGIGVFKVRNMNNAEIKIEDLRSKTNVLNIELNLLDPLLKPY